MQLALEARLIMRNTLNQQLPCTDEQFSLLLPAYHAYSLVSCSRLVYMDTLRAALQTFNLDMGTPCADLRPSVTAPCLASYHLSRALSP